MPRKPSDEGVARNERLTATTAVVLVLLLAVEGVTILAIRPLLSWHVFVGMLLIPPVALKLASTGYRMLRYYGRSPAYVRRGPPPVCGTPTWSRCTTSARPRPGCPMS